MNRIMCMYICVCFCVCVDTGDCFFQSYLNVANPTILARCEVDGFNVEAQAAEDGGHIFIRLVNEMARPAENEQQEVEIVLRKNQQSVSDAEAAHRIQSPTDVRDLARFELLLLLPFTHCSCVLNVCAETSTARRSHGAR